MKTKYKYIEFRRRFGADENFPGLPVEYMCENRKKVILGIVSYLEKWHEWEFAPFPNMGFTVECCRDIADFLDQLNKGGKP